MKVGKPVGLLDTEAYPLVTVVRLREIRDAWVVIHPVMVAGDRPHVMWGKCSRSRGRRGQVSAPRSSPLHSLSELIEKAGTLCAGPTLIRFIQLRHLPQHL